MQRINKPLLMALLIVLPIYSQSSPGPSSATGKGLEARARQGDIKAQVALGYERYTAKNYEEAAKLFFAVIGQGKTDPDSAYAYFALAVMYQQGVGVPRNSPQGNRADPVRAFVYFSLAAALDNQDAKTSLQVVARSLTPEQLAQAQAELLALVAEVAQTAKYTPEQLVQAQAEVHELVAWATQSEKTNRPSASGSFKFVQGQRVYVVAVEANSADHLDAAKPNLLLERLTKDQFIKQKSFRVANALRDSDFVFLVILDSAGPVEEVAVAVSPADYVRVGASLDALRNSALWQGDNHFKPGLALATAYSFGLYRQNVVAGLVTQFHKDTLWKRVLKVKTSDEEKAALENLRIQNPSLWEEVMRSR